LRSDRWVHFPGRERWWFGNISFVFLDQPLAKKVPELTVYFVAYLAISHRDARAKA
jgi:hypothetical protein